MLDRVKQKASDSKLKRPEWSAYESIQTLQPDQQILDSLKEVRPFSDVGDSNNVGKY